MRFSDHDHLYNGFRLAASITVCEELVQRLNERLPTEWTRDHEFEDRLRAYASGMDYRCWSYSGPQCPYSVVLSTCVGDREGTQGFYFANITPLQVQAEERLRPEYYTAVFDSFVELALRPVSQELGLSLILDHEAPLS